MVSIDRILRRRRTRTRRPTRVTTRRAPVRRRPAPRALATSRRPTGGALDRLIRLRRQARVTPKRVPATVNIRGVPVTTRGGTRQPTVRDAGLSAEDLANLIGGGGFGGGGGGGGLSAADRRAEIRLGAGLSADEAKRQRDFDADQARIAQDIEDKRIADALAAQRLRDVEGLRGERQSRFVDLIGRDQARAVLFALGLGPEADIFTTRAAKLESTLPALKGARTLELETEAALSRLLGQSIDIGAQGVAGLGTAQGAATAFQRGGLSAQQLLASAFGIGDLGTGRQPGIGADELLRIVQSVTPVGNL